MSVLASIRGQLAPVHREGFPFIAAFGLASLVLLWLWSPLGWLGVLATLWCAFFFRDPQRVTPIRDGIIVAPADGRVSRIANAVPPQELALGEQALPRISIFMSVFDCHVNRSPLTGKIERIVYHHGAFVSADLDKASENNERNSLVIATGKAQIGVVQIAGLLARRIVPESRLDVARRRFDPFGAVTVTGGLLLGVYALSQAPLHGWGSARTISLLAVAAVLELAFLVIETRVEAPLLPMRIFRLPTVAGANAVALLLGASFYAFIFVGTLYMQQVLRYSALQTGLAWLAASITSVALAGLSQALVTRVSAKFVMAVGMALIGGGILWATAAPVHGRFWADLAGPFFVAGAGTAFAFIPVSIAGLAGIAHHEAGLASIGVAIASTVAATHFKTLIHSGSAAPAALTGGFQWAFWVCGAIGVAAVPITFLLVRSRDLVQTADPQPALVEPRAAA